MIRQRYEKRPLEEVLRRNRELEGAVEPHTFELVLEPDDVRHAVHALSLELEDPETVRREIDSTAWLLEDTRRARPKLPLTVVTVRNDGQPELERTERICVALGANLVLADRVEDWASSAVRDLMTAAR